MKDKKDLPINTTPIVELNIWHDDNDNSWKFASVDIPQGFEPQRRTWFNGDYVEVLEQQLQAAEEREAKLKETLDFYADTIRWLPESESSAECGVIDYTDLEPLEKHPFNSDGFEKMKFGGKRARATRREVYGE